MINHTDLLDRISLNTDRDSCVFEGFLIRKELLEIEGTIVRNVICTKDCKKCGDSKSRKKLFRSDPSVIISAKPVEADEDLVMYKLYYSWRN